MPSMRLQSAAGLVVSLALIATGCSTAGPTHRPLAPSPSPSVAASASTPAASARVDPSESGGAGAAGASVAPQSPSAEPSGEPLTGTAGPGCGTGQLGFFAHRGEVPDTLHFGGATVEFTTAWIQLRNETYVADDAIPGGIGLSPDEIAVRVDPGTHILLRGDGLALTDVTVRAAPWTNVAFGAGLASLPEGGDGLARRARADGSISVRAPTAPGDYLVEFLPRWQSACLQGDGTAYSRIKVNG